MNPFITFEGGEGSGKSLHSRTLYRKLTELCIPAILIHEPGGTLLGEKVRQLLKKSWQIPLSPLAELMLFNASRSQLVKEVIQPNLKEGKLVICDRFTDSTIAYQSYGRGLDITLVNTINRMASQGLKPDLTFLLDIPPETGLSRKKSNGNDRFERETIAFHKKVRGGFLKLASEEPERWYVIDATLSRKEVGHLIWDKVCQLLSTYSIDVKSRPYNSH
jgi:dTMP kinase